MTAKELAKALNEIIELGAGDFPVKVWFTNVNYEVEEHDVSLVAGSFTSVGAPTDNVTVFLQK